MELTVLLNETPVGRLVLLKGGDATRFSFLDSYKNLAPRPVLGQYFEDDLDRTWRSTQRLPEFFSNLLPEGRLRAFISEQLNLHEDREFHLIRHLGDDLPGAVRVIQLEGGETATEDQDDGIEDAQEVGEAPEGGMHFSLAGIQLKFSMRETDRGLTLPVKGRSGDWIVKLPDLRYAGVPENEWSIMTWAAESGVNVPEVKLVETKRLYGLPEKLTAGFRENLCYAVRRFDRPVTGGRVHIEDFAQVLGVYSERKYRAFNYETLGKIIFGSIGEDALREFVGRLIFIALSGNSDAHLKNWSLIYPDGVRFDLSPAYDLVSTIIYPDYEDGGLALNLNKARSFEAVCETSLRRLARKVEFDEDVVVRWSIESVAAIRSAWSRVRDDLRLSNEAKARIEAHMAKIARGIV